MRWVVYVPDAEFDNWRKQQGIPRATAIRNVVGGVLQMLKPMGRAKVRVMESTDQLEGILAELDADEQAELGHLQAMADIKAKVDAAFDAAAQGDEL